MRFSASLAFVALGFPLLGCEGATPIANEQVFAGRYVTLHASPSIRVCPATVAWADRFVVTTSAFLSVAPAHLDDYLYDGSMPFACPESHGVRADCAIPERHFLMSTHWIHEHEIAHVIAGALGRAPAAFEEGLADALGDARLADPDVLVVRDLRVEELESATFNAQSAGNAIALYARMADFTRFLIERFGIERYVAFYSHTPYWATLDEIRGSFAREMSVTLDEALRTWSTEPPRRFHDTRLRLTECDAADESVANVGDRWSVSGSLVCGGPGSEVTPWTEHIPLQFARDGIYRIDFDRSAAVGASATVTECASGGSTVTVLQSMFASLRGGRAYVEFDGGSGVETPTRGLTLTRLGEESTTCEAATVITVPPGTWELRTSPNHWPGRIDDAVLGEMNSMWFAVRVDADRLVSIFVASRGSIDLDGTVNTFTDPTRFRVCRGVCGVPAACEVFGERDAAHELVRGGETLFVELRAPVATRDRGVIVVVN